ncbi:MAG: hypothetical protein HOV80_06015 [Polyangiaceae bacterium]|nr:hypothetical protein [Polyangiaceae bacterium]
MRTRPILYFTAPALLSLLGFVAACGDDGEGSGGGSTQATNGTGQTGTGNTGATTGGSTDACGPEPTVLLSGTFTSYLNQLPVIDGVVTSDSCPGQQYIPDENGFVSAKVARDVPFYPKIVAQSFAPIRLGEEILVADYDASAELYPESLLAIVPTWSTSTPTILAVIRAQSSASDECKDLSGYTFDIPAHPEAEIMYYSGSPIPQADPMATATGDAGLATFSGLAATAPGEFIELTVEKAGCEPSFISYPQTGRYVLENGVVTAAISYVPAIAPP